MFLDSILNTKDRITAAIHAASQSTGTNFDYLLRTALRESNLNPTAAAKTSSARGLFQFIDTTWLMTVKEDGPAFGLQNQASAIEKTADGQYVVRDPQVRAQILKLRDNPEVAAVMAGAFSRRNAAEIESVLGRTPTSGELYIAHFLGANGAKRFLAMRANQPDASAAAAFPNPARANRSIFYGPNGARSVDEVYRKLVAKHDGPSIAPSTAVAHAANPLTAIPNLLNRIVSAFVPARVPAEAPAGAIARIERTAPPTGAAPVRQTAPVQVANANLNPRRVNAPVAVNPVSFTETPPLRTSYGPEDPPIFRGLFQNEANGPLSPRVQELWGGINPIARR